MSEEKERILFALLAGAASDASVGHRRRPERLGGLRLGPGPLAPPPRANNNIRTCQAQTTVATWSPERGRLEKKAALKRNFFIH